MAITSTTCSGSLPYLGYGLGLRVEHYEALLANPGAVQWLEVVSENYMVNEIGRASCRERVSPRV